MNRIENDTHSISNKSPKVLMPWGFFTYHDRDRNRGQYARTSRNNPNPIKIAGPMRAAVCGPVISTSAPITARMIATHVAQPM
jgi:hypothetical protein